jgi:hypothetical protein
MSAISTASINPPIPCQGVKFGYTTPPTAPVTSDSLGYNLASTTLLSGATITGASQKVLLCQVGNITAIPAGTYIATYSATFNAVQPDIQSYLEVVAFTGGANIATSTKFYMTGTNNQYESTTGTITFKAGVPFTANLYGGTEAGGTGTPVNPIFLQLVRIA